MFAIVARDEPCSFWDAAELAKRLQNPQRSRSYLTINASVDLLERRRLCNIRASKSCVPVEYCFSSSYYSISLIGQLSLFYLLSIFQTLGFIHVLVKKTLQDPPMEIRNAQAADLKDSYKVTEYNGSGIDAGHESPRQDGYEDVWGDSKNDMRDMLRLGKKQEFKRNFHLLSALGFVSVYMATWEFVLVSLSVGFTNGGFAGLFWCFITTVICYSTIVMSLAEMESMAPTSGGQYHWVSQTSF